MVARELLALPDLPFETGHIWDWFCDLSRQRQSGMAAEPIGVTDALSYFELMRLRPARWELQCLLDLDDAFMRSRSDKTTGVVTGAGDMKRIKNDG